MLELLGDRDLTHKLWNNYKNNRIVVLIENLLPEINDLNSLAIEAA